MGGVCRTSWVGLSGQRWRGKIPDKRVYSAAWEVFKQSCLRGAEDRCCWNLPVALIPAGGRTSTDFCQMLVIFCCLFWGLWVVLVVAFLCQHGAWVFSGKAWGYSKFPVALLGSWELSTLETVQTLTCMNHFHKWSTLRLGNTWT